ncbi:MAG: AraC family transcriptional regulator [Clostridiales bacterium]
MDYKMQIQNSIDYIKKNLCENLRLNEIAKQAHFSEFHFHRLFKKDMGISVMKYVQNLRLEKAAESLENTDEKITDIALDCQFGSEESFSRAFKKLYGKTPRDYRKFKNQIKCSNIFSMAA